MSRPRRRHGRAAASPRPRKTEERPARPKGLVWSGTVGFGLVNIPVTLHSAESAKELRFTMLDRRDLSPIGYRKINKATGAEVSADEIVKGYRLEDGRFVTLTEEDFRRASPERTQRIEIHSFIDASRIDPVQFEKPYYLAPAAKHEKAYALLREAMKRAGKAAVATVVLRAREYLAALLARGPVLTLELLRYSEELGDPAELRLPAENLPLPEAELEMAGKLIDGLSAPWKPEGFKDDYRGELLAFIEKKAAAGKAREAAPVPSAPPPATPPTDIMALLKKSLERRRGTRA